jgi:hypothetical protein
MTKKKHLRKEKKRIAQLRARELETLRKLRISHPALYRKCGPNREPCCQAITEDGYRCTRAALTTKSYIHRVRCCLLCWQHALIYGVYGLLKIGQAAAESTLSWEDYCFLYPEKCEAYFEVQDEYE